MTAITHFPSGRIAVDGVPVVFHASRRHPVCFLPCGAFQAFGDLGNWIDVQSSRGRGDLYVPGWPNQAAVAAHWRLVCLEAVQRTRLGGSL